MGAPEGNQNGVKLKDPDLRQKAYKQYCDWLARGKSQKSFTFVEGDLMCTYRTIESYMKLYPFEFPSIHMELAKCKGYQRWEQVVEDSAEGINKDANTASLQMVMRNKFDWDKEDKDPVYKHETDMDKVLKKWEEHGSKQEAVGQPQQLERED